VVVEVIVFVMWERGAVMEVGIRAATAAALAKIYRVIILNRYLEISS